MSEAGRTAVTRALAAIMERRYPGTVWLPVEAAQLDSATGAGKVVRRLAAPQDPDASGVENSDLPGGACAA